MIINGSILEWFTSIHDIGMFEVDCIYSLLLAPVKDLEAVLRAWRIPTKERNRKMNQKQWDEQQGTIVELKEHISQIRMM